MRKFSTLTGQLAGMALPLMLVACASGQPVVVEVPAAPSLSSDAILRESQGMAHLSERLKTGEKMIAQGKVMAREGQVKIDEGNRLIDEGNKIKHDAEESYRNIRN